MADGPDDRPAAVAPTDGIVHTRSPLSFDETVDLLGAAISAAGAALFAVVDHSGEARRAGLVLRDTKLLIFGNAKGGTPAMVAAPLAALDLPLKILVWVDDNGAVWMTHLTPDWLSARHGIPVELTSPFEAADGFVRFVAAAAAAD